MGIRGAEFEGGDEEGEVDPCRAREERSSSLRRASVVRDMVPFEWGFRTPEGTCWKVISDGATVGNHAQAAEMPTIQGCAHCAASTPHSN